MMKITAGFVDNVYYQSSDLVEDFVEIMLEDDAHLTYQIYEFSAKKVHFLFHLQRNAVLDCQMLFVNCNAYVILEIVLCGQGAQATIRGLSLLSHDVQLRLEIRQHHMATHTTSNLIVKGIVADCAQLNYHGTIRIERIARESVAVQENKNILLSRGAQAVSIPNLEVLTNDVRCFHGSAVARCDEEQLLYAMSRGMSEKQAQRLVLQAFAADVCKNDTMRDSVERYVECL